MDQPPKNRGQGLQERRILKPSLIPGSIKNEPQEKMIQLSINKLRKLPKILLIIFAIILVLNIAAITFSTITGHNYAKGFLPMLRMDFEGNLGTYFSALILIISSVLLFLIFKSHQNRGLNDHRHWLVLSIVFLCLSVDESIAFHECFIEPIRDLLNINHLFYFAWVIPGMVLCALLAVYFYRFYMNLPSRYRRLFGISAFLFVGGAIGMEIIDGYVFSFNQEYNLTYNLLTTLEESMEMVGIIIFVYALINILDTDMQAGETITL